MEPGRELDALVAEKVMGLVIVADDWPCGYTPDGCGLEASSFLPPCYGGFDSPGPVIAVTNDGWPPKPDDEVEGGVYAFVEPISFYSTDIAAAWTVDKPGWLWEFQEAVGVLSVTLYTSPALRHKAINMYPVLPEGVILIRRIWLDDKAQTYAWLRCLAALEAVGVICVPEGESITLGDRAVLENVTIIGVGVGDD